MNENERKRDNQVSENRIHNYKVLL